MTYNGKFIYVADFMTIPNEIPPALKPGADLTRGASFAVADASIRGSPKESVSLKIYIYITIYIDIYDQIILVYLKVEDFSLNINYFSCVYLDDTESTSAKIQKYEIDMDR